MPAPFSFARRDEAAFSGNQGVALCDTGIPQDRVVLSLLDPALEFHVEEPIMDGDLTGSSCGAVIGLSFLRLMTDIKFSDNVSGLDVWICR